MPRAIGTAIENNFGKGLITEATGLNFPENACTETYNCIFTETGKVKRRLGFELEEGYSTTSFSGNLVSEFIWDNVAGQGELTFVVVQLGTLLRFYQIGELSAVSTGLKSFSVDLNGFKVSGAPDISSIPVQLTSGNGFLFVSNRYCNSFYVKYNADTDSISTHTISIKTRDFDGATESVATEFRPATLTSAHKYNLQNQGWLPYVDTVASLASDPISYWRGTRGDYPSNVDIWWLYKNSDDKMDVLYANRISLGNSPAPRGHYLFDTFYKDRSSVSGVPGLVVETSSYERPSSIAFHAGRVFYAGVNYQNYNFKIFFSQIVENEENIGKCYQVNDPTSENLSDLLPTDGGVIVIPEVGGVIKMVSLGSDLFIFATNGVWSITGSSGIGFTASDYTVRRVSTIPAISSTSFTLVNGLPVWWNYDGIYSLQIDPTTQSVSVQSLTDQSIKAFFNEIPADSKLYAKASYNSLTKIVQWLYKNSTGIYYNSILNLNTLTGAFYPWTVFNDVDYPRLMGLVATKGYSKQETDTPVLNSSDSPVQDSSLDAVVVTVIENAPVPSEFKYLTLLPSNQITFSETTNFEYYDFPEYFDGTDYDSYFISGYKVHAEGIRKFQTNYVQVFSEVTTGSSLNFRARRSFSRLDTSGKFSNYQQAYKEDDNYTITSRRLKVLGNGNAVQFECRSSPGQPFNVIGFVTFESANQLP